MKFRFRIERTPSPLWMIALLPVIAVVITFVISMLILQIVKANPFEAFYYILISPLSTRTSALEVLVKATPLILTSSAVTLAFASGYWNIGAEGQFFAGAITAAFLGTQVGAMPSYIAIPLMFMGAFLAGMIWAFIPAWLKVKMNVDEVVTTLLMNYVILFFLSFLLNGPWRDPVSGWPQSPAIADSAVLPKLLERSRLHLGFIVAIMAVILVWFILSKTALGLQMRAVGKGKDAARFMGVNIGRTLFLTALISGGIAGLAGVTEVAGIHFHITDAISDGFGYTGIIGATLGNLNPWGAGLAAIFLGLIATGAQSVSRSMDLPVFLGNVVQAILLLVTLSIILLRNYSIKKVT